ncbi:MAG: hypothetical protein K8R53_00985, partial [Bacteroidales bacterium]|nr:hypothetical protein [Bacteroidales bacterium]
FIKSTKYDWLLLKNTGIDRISNSELKQFARLFACIDIFYKSLRSGINRPRNNTTQFYIKPVIFLYAMNVLKQPWDKKSIKQHFFGSELRKQVRDHDSPDILTFEGGQDAKKQKLLIKDIF